MNLSIYIYQNLYTGPCPEIFEGGVVEFWIAGVFSK